MEHLTYLKRLNFILALFMATFGTLFVAALVLPGLKLLFGREILGLTFIIAGACSFGMLFFVAVLHVYTGFMVSAARGRLAQTFLAIVQLSHVPFGTVYALYALWVCWINEPTRQAFDNPRGRRIT